jgi:DNA helicase II / ATP-dependent DNA helicase PcrA
MNNRIIIAAAGSGKTSFLVKESLLDKTTSTLITTFTIENQKQINSYLVETNKVIPQNVEVLGWWTFLLRDCVRPYQNFVYSEKRVRTICRVQGRSTRYVKKEQFQNYFFHNGDEIYSDKISEFACLCNEKSGGLVIRRLEQIYEYILVDESQELSGYDLDFLELLLRSNVNILLAGDIRQATYVTNYSPKNEQFRGQSVAQLYEKWESDGLSVTLEKKESYRCNQVICSFADRLYPNLPRTHSGNDKITSHDGIFIVRRADVIGYIDRFTPQILRYNVRSNTEGLNALNFGQAQGQNFDRVLIFPTQPMMKYLKNGRIQDAGNIPKFYVAVTRARYSVAFVYESNSCFKEIIHY